MPTVNLLKTEIDSKLGELTEEQFQDICFDYGLELDEVTSEYEMVKKEQSLEKAENCSKAIIYKINVPANRYDLLCVEGLMRSLMIFQKKINTPRYLCNPSIATVKMIMTQATQQVRPYAVAAILRNISFTKARYDSFIDLQDKLHQSIGRERSVASIGTHDLDTIKAPFIYDAQRPKDIKFIPLNESRVFTAEELMKHYSGDSHLKAYLPIIMDSEVYPVIYDSCGTVLSLPPIINGDHSKIKLTTENVFIEITATSLHNANVALDTVVAMFSEYCSSSFQVEPVEIVLPDGTSHQYPKLPYRMESVSVDHINKLIGIDITADEMVALLEKMCLKAEVCGSELKVEVPPTRHDILHRRDIVGNVAIGYGFNNLPKKDTRDVVREYPDAGVQMISLVTYVLRIEMVKYGFTEGLTFALCSRNDISTKLNKELKDSGAVHVSNPKTQQFQVVRTQLLPGLLNTINCNQHMPLPIRLFEVQDVVFKDSTNDVGARNQRRLGAVHFGMEPDFESTQDVLFSIMSSLGYSYQESPIDGLPGQLYTLEDVDDSMLWKGRSFAIKLTNGRDIGRLGILVPSVMKNFNIRKGFASMFELEIEHFV